MDKKYLKVSILLQIISMIGICILVTKIDGFDKISFCDLDAFLKNLFSNMYFANMFCSISSIILLYCVQLKYCKFKIKRDIRFNEAMQTIYKGTELGVKILSNREEKKDMKDDLLDFYKSNKTEMELCNNLFLYNGNEIIWDSIQTVFFININFKLLSIINNIKNRIPTYESKWNSTLHSVEDYEKTKAKENLTKANNDIYYYLMDMKFLVGYCQSLLDYFNFDMSFAKSVNDYVLQEVPNILDLLKRSNKEQSKIYKRARRKAHINQIKKYFQD